MAPNASEGRARARPLLVDSDDEPLVADLLEAEDVAAELGVRGEDDRAVLERLLRRRGERHLEERGRVGARAVLRLLQELVDVRLAVDVDRLALGLLPGAGLDVVVVDRRPVERRDDPALDG